MPFTTVQEFHGWEASTRDTIDFKKIYADVAGDTLCGLALSQIIFWNLPNKEGNSKLRIVKDGYEWLAISRAEWWEQTRLTARQVDTILGKLCKNNPEKIRSGDGKKLLDVFTPMPEKLEDQPIVVKRLYRFNGSPMLHLRLNYPRLFHLLNHFLEAPAVNPYYESVKSNSQDGEVDIADSVKSLTETSSKTTTEEKELLSSATAFAGQNGVSSVGNESQEHSEQTELPINKVTEAEQRSSEQALVNGSSLDSGTKPRSTKQLEADAKKRAKVQALQDALGIKMLAKSSEKRMGQIVGILNADGIPCEQFNDYVDFVRKIALKEGGWSVTADSLLAKERPSLYPTDQEAKRKLQEQRGQHQASPPKKFQRGSMFSNLVNGNEKGNNHD